MTDIEQKARELANEVLNERGMAGRSYIDRDIYTHEALCRAIEQHEAFRQEVSDAVEEYCKGHGIPNYGRFIIPAPKPDPLVDIVEWLGGEWTPEEYVKEIRAALEARGLTITTVEKD